ncbi:hypothetical protein GYA19_04545 [Candidatus Beckwithbacteria bacterium]|nr:hypothetical protein [Candidatus Beckwithbacteria bacterium]
MKFVLNPAKLIIFCLGLIILSFSFFHLKNDSKTLKAQTKKSNAIIGANVTDHYTEWADAAANAGPNGWVTIMPEDATDVTSIQNLINNYPDVNIALRTHYPDNVPNYKTADTWTKTLSQLQTKEGKIYVMPWNEPNFERETGGVGKATDPNDSAAASMVKNYTNYFMNKLSQAGLLHDNVEMLSPMIGISAPNASSFIKALGSEYFNQFYGMSLALYDFETCGSALCNDDSALNAANYREYLSSLGLSDIKVFALESGVVNSNGNCPTNVPDCATYNESELLNFIQKVLPIWQSDPNFVMASILSYNPEITDRTPWLWGTQFESVMKLVNNSDKIYTSYDPNINANLHTFTKVDNADLNYFDKVHDIDTNLPNVSNLFEGIDKPKITGIYKMNMIDNFDFPSDQWGEAHATGFSIPNGTNIQLPPSGYNIDSNGHQAMILYADEHSITVNYTANGNIVDGYTLTLSNINVNADLLAMYKEGLAQGLNVAIDAFQSLGTSNGQDVLVMIRDKGSVMDLRWNEWWKGVVDKTKAIPPELLKPLGLPRLTPTKDYTCKVGDSLPPEGVLRPSPCEDCSLAVKEPTQSCATQPTLSKKFKWECGEEDDRCNASDYIYYDTWWANFKIDTKNTTYVPFAGYRDITNVESKANRSPDMNNYLRTYFEGTSLYDREDRTTKYDPTNLTDQQNLIWEQGVFRKLAPVEIQDGLRKKMIKKGYNYYICDCQKNNCENGEAICHYMSEWNQQAFAYNGRSGRFPPEIKYEECQASDSSTEYHSCINRVEAKYMELLKKYLNTDYGKLWAYIPMFSREDAPGIVTMTIEHIPGTLGEAGTTPTKSTYQYPMSFPHLAGVYESTQELFKLLTPFDKQQSIVDSQNSTSLNQSSNLGGIDNEVLLAQANTQSDSQEVKLLAEQPQNSSSTTTPPTWYKNSLRISKNNDGDYYWNAKLEKNTEFPNSGAYDMAHFHYTVTVNGIEVLKVVNSGESVSGGINQSGKIPDGIVKPGEKVLIQMSITEGTQWGQATKEDLVPKTFTQECEIGKGGEILTETCVAPPPIPEPTPGPCTPNGSGINKVCEAEDPIKDINPNDEVCCNVNARAYIKNYRIAIPEGVYQSMDHCCPPKYVGDNCPRQGGTVTMTRQIEVRLKIPYLEKIYQYTTDKETGFFNIFRPHSEIKSFPKNDAKTGIKYVITAAGGENSDAAVLGITTNFLAQAQDSSEAPRTLNELNMLDAEQLKDTLIKEGYNAQTVNEVSISPNEGELYYPYLGGIQLTKKCVSEQILTPLSMQDSFDKCDFSGTNINNLISLYENQVSPSGTPDPISTELAPLLAAATKASGVDPTIIAAILAIESPEYYKNPNSTSKSQSACGAQGPMQILNAGTNGENINCDSSKGSICSSYCENGELNDYAKKNLDVFNAWKSYSDPGMDIYSLKDALIVGSRMLNTKAGGGGISLNDTDKIIKASKSYYGEKYDSSLTAAQNCHKGERFARLNNLTYCEYVFWHAGIYDQIK